MRNPVKDISDEKPVIGQRVLVWDRFYQTWIIAYWERDLRFVERNLGDERTVRGEKWLPLPPRPESARGGVPRDR